MRTAALVAILASLASWLLAATMPSRPTVGAAVTALTLPAEALVGERIAVRGSILLPDETELYRRFSVCHLETDRCVTSGRGTIKGPEHWAGYAGELAASDHGTYHISWTLYTPWAGDAHRVATRVESKMMAREPTN